MIENFKYQISNIKFFHLLLISIVLLAAFLRLYKLGVNPPSLDWDEASLGYNAYSLLKTGKDEFGRAWPVSIRSFEDYKPAVYTYLTIPTVLFFGLTEFAVRLPSAIMGIATVAMTYFLIRILFVQTDLNSCKGKIIDTQRLALLTTFFLAVSPWHIQFSRVAFEANVALFFVVSGLYFFLKGLYQGRYLLVSAILLALSFYSYHSPRLVIPMMLAGWVVYFKEKIRFQKKYVVLAICTGMVLLLPFMYEITTAGKARLSSVTVLSGGDQLNESITKIESDTVRGDWLGRLLHNRRVVYGKAIVKGYLDHFNLDFLFLRGDGPDRHHARDMGMLYFWEAPFVLFGFIVLLKNRQTFPVLWWFLVAPLASALTTGTPHAVRALIYLPTYQLFTAVGVAWFFIHMRSHLRPAFFYTTISGLIIVSSSNFFYYLQQYFVHTPVEAAKDWQYGYKQAVGEIMKQQDQVDHVVVTYAYDQPYIFVLFYEKIDPDWYQKQWSGAEIMRDRRSFGKFEFRKITWDTDQQLHNVLFVGTPSEIPPDSLGVIHDIPFPDGTVAFRVAKR